MGRVLPILFNTDMVRAILDGRKTVTRRVIKPHNARKASEQEYCQGNGLWVDPSADNGDYEGHIKDYSISPCWISWSYYIQKYAPYRTGDILYVRETWCGWYLPHREWLYCYKATDSNGNRVPTGPEYDDEVDRRNWRPSIHMPKAAARIWLMVTDVRVERLQDITPEQAVREGAIKRPQYSRWGGEKCLVIHGRYRQEFSKLWDSTIKKPYLALYGWNANPWVWVIEFERCEKPEGEKLCQKSI